MRKLILAVALTLVGSFSAQAQLPDPISATDRLRFESARLDQAVSMSHLGPQVRNATYNFAIQSDRLYRCVIARPMRPLPPGRFPEPGRPGRPGRPNQPGRPTQVSAQCNQEAIRTQNFYRVAENMLWNTQQTAPQVHYQFLRTSQAHQQAQMSLNSVPSGLLRAAGYMNRVQYNFQGRGPAAIINQCLNWGQAYGILQVRELYVNGRIIPLGGIVNIRQACQLVANYSIPGFQFEFEE